jgi:hypothetical protein
MKQGTKAEASAAASALVRRRYAKMTPLERSRLASKAASAPWENLTPEERKTEMKRRLAGKGKKKKGGRKAAS